ncbi:antitoxin [Rhodococcus rhodnii]|uniref:Antitoxin n=2 Tax=Rhodococcus rhodnii TaxID=38312 RepID=R7WU91_9NOCA|nr:antitoxin [Rhodococcus rhodnii]EOM77734.1 hypothetical protein Rrhod_0886 [Rhodococcus rhodnii LMG 5362]TXG89015.1 antitoxin [Rhodococcus rhodnii]
MSWRDSLDNLIGKGKKAATDNADKIHDAVDKASKFADDKTGGKYHEQIGKAAGAAKNAVPRDAAAEPGGTETPAPEASAPETPAPEPPAPEPPKTEQPRTEPPKTDPPTP